MADKTEVKVQAVILTNMYEYTSMGLHIPQRWSHRKLVVHMLT